MVFGFIYFDDCHFKQFADQHHKECQAYQLQQLKNHHAIVFLKSN